MRQACAAPTGHFASLHLFATSPRRTLEFKSAPASSTATGVDMGDRYIYYTGNQSSRVSTRGCDPSDEGRPCAGA